MADDVIIYSAGAIPGVPGEVTPGVYTIDSDARTATFIAPLPADPVDPALSAPALADAPASEPAPAAAPATPAPAPTTQPSI